jgi:hypothetical protein
MALVTFAESKVTRPPGRDPAPNQFAAMGGTKPTAQFHGYPPNPHNRNLPKEKNSNPS